MTPAPAVRIGILGGTFDPVHLGHLAIAEAARTALDLDRVLFLPAGSPPHKPGSVDAPAADRVAMVELAIAGHPGFELSRVDVDRPGPSYTADSIERIAAAERAAGREPDLVLIMSVETLGELPEWHEPARLLAACILGFQRRGIQNGRVGKVAVLGYCMGGDEEAISVERVPLEEALRLIASGEIEDAKTAGALLLYLRSAAGSG